MGAPSLSSFCFAFTDFFVCVCLFLCPRFGIQLVGSIEATLFDQSRARSTSWRLRAAQTVAAGVEELIAARSTPHTHGPGDLGSPSPTPFEPKHAVQPSPMELTRTEGSPRAGRPIGAWAARAADKRLGGRVKSTGVTVCGPGQPAHLLPWIATPGQATASQPPRTNRAGAAASVKYHHRLRQRPRLS